MGSQTLPKLPTINFTSEILKQGTSPWIETSNKVRHALEEYGCFVALYDVVSSKIDNKIFGAMEELFSLPKENKMKNMSSKTYFGYIGEHGISPVNESMGIDNATSLEGVQSFTNLMWPNGNDPFCRTAYSYSKVVAELEQTVKRMVFDNYGVENYESCVGSYNYHLKFIKYRGPKMNESNIGVPSHTDKSFITILQQNQVSGLQVQTDDGEWLDIEPMPSSFVILAGDAFMVWSNGRVKAPHHRVIMHGNNVRYSIGLFSFNNGIIHVPPQLVDDEHPLQFKPFDHLDYYRFSCHTPVDPRHSVLAKAYCGVDVEEHVTNDYLGTMVAEKESHGID